VTLLGSKESFGIILGAPDVASLRSVEVWVGGWSITPNDSSAYVPSFSTALAASARRLRTELNFLRYEELFLGMSVEEAIHKLVSASPAVASAWVSLRFADWGPTTDDFLCFLLPLRGKLYLACYDNASKHVHAAVVMPYDLVEVLEAANRELLSPSPDA
jgi:hypothetical protein